MFSRVWTWLAPRMDRLGGAEHRRRLLEGLSGDVLEVGAGNGLNFAHYPPAVTTVLAVEPEQRLRAIAADAAGRAPVPVRVVAGRAEHLPAPDSSVDAVVCSLVLCSVRSQAAALREVRRVLRQGGELRFYEHVRADGGALRRLQMLLDATVWPPLAAGCHAARDTVAAIRDAGFVIERLERFRFPDSALPSPTAPHVLGSARVA